MSRSHGPTEFSNWRNIITGMKFTAFMLTIGFNSVTVGFFSMQPRSKTYAWVLQCVVICCVQDLKVQGDTKVIHSDGQICHRSSCSKHNSQTIHLKTVSKLYLTRL